MEIEKDFRMSNQPWECPRCRTIYAPWMPSCHCKFQSGSASLPVASTQSRTERFDFSCTHCGEFHGIWNGKSVNCASL